MNVIVETGRPEKVYLEELGRITITSERMIVTIIA